VTGLLLADLNHDDTSTSPSPARTAVSHDLTDFAGTGEGRFTIFDKHQIGNGRGGFGFHGRFQCRWHPGPRCADKRYGRRDCVQGSHLKKVYRGECLRADEWSGAKYRCISSHDGAEVLTEIIAS
jgi:hypothetical protein